MAFQKETDSPVYKREIEAILAQHNPDPNMAKLVEQHGRFTASLAAAQPRRGLLKALRSVSSRPPHPHAITFHLSHFDLRAGPTDPGKNLLDQISAFRFYEAQPRIAKWLKHKVEPYQPAPETPAYEAPFLWSDKYSSLIATLQLICDFPEGELRKSIQAVIEHVPTSICWMARFPLPMNPDNSFTSLSLKQGDLGYKPIIIEHSNMRLSAREILVGAINLVNKNSPIPKRESVKFEPEKLNPQIT